MLIIYYITKICYNLVGDIMRLRNVKNAREIVDNSSFVVHEPKEFKGKYNEVFGNDNPIYIEIGMGKGKFIIENVSRTGGHLASNLGIVELTVGLHYVFDSPKDKDLDMDKYKRFLSLLSRVENIQIFLTGSILDEAAYKEAIPNAHYLPTLSEENRLLKMQC